MTTEAMTCRVCGSPMICRAYRRITHPSEPATMALAICSQTMAHGIHDDYLAKLATHYREITREEFFAEHERRVTP